MKTFFIPLLVSISAGLVLWWVNQERYDVRFTVSERVPVTFGAPTTEAVQQIEVKNLGKKPAERIQINLPAKIAAYEVFKNSAADQIDEFKIKEGLEIVYSALPTEGSFRVVFKTSGDGIPKESIRVRHGNGIATYALNTGSSWTSLFLQGALFTIYIIGFYYFMRDSAKSSLQFDAEHSPDRILKKKSKPWIIPEEAWTKARKKALVAFSAEGLGHNAGDMVNSKTFRRLNQDTLDFLSPEEWQDYKLAAGNQVVKQISAYADSSYSSDRLLPLLSITRPAQMPSDKWEELRKSLAEKFLTKRVEEVRNHGQVSRLQQTKPETINSKDWEESQGRIIDMIFIRLAANIEYTHDPFSVVETKDAKALPSELQKKLNEHAYSAACRKLPDLRFLNEAKEFLKQPKPAWLSDQDYQKYKEAADRVIESSAAIEVFSNLANELPLDDPSLTNLRPQLRAKALQIDQKIRLEGKRISEEEKRVREASNKLDAETAELIQNQKQIVKQLNILNALFEDPKSLERIEPYDNPFAVGNLENLKRVANIFATSKGPQKASAKKLQESQQRKLAINPPRP